MAEHIHNRTGAFIFGLFTGLAIVLAGVGAVTADRMGFLGIIDNYLPVRQESANTVVGDSTRRIVNEESAVIDVAEKASPSVVTVSISTKRQSMQPFFMDPFGLFGGQQFFRQDEPQQVKQDIGSGFVVDGQNGLVVTNKHVVSTTGAKYTVISTDDTEYDVQKIYRDPVNDLAILKVEAKLPALEMGDSDSLKVGQFVVAIGTALGEFRHTVTTGVVSGLGRGIEAGNGYGGSAEQLDGVIQTDAAINPGNSGGPLLNSAGQVIGVNVAVSAQGENIGFALPINLVRESLNNFNETGQFDRAYLGVQYQMVTREIAMQRDWPEGAFVAEVVAGSPAEAAGLEQGDIITEIDGQKIRDTEGGLASVIGTLKIGQKVSLKYDRDGEEKTIEVELKAVEE
jgi:S1-C subfamily serine protease